MLGSLLNPGGLSYEKWMLEVSWILAGSATESGCLDSPEPWRAQLQKVDVIHIRFR